MSEKTEKLAKIPKSVKSWLTSDYFRQQVALVLPKHLKAERFVRVAISALSRIPKLASCTPESVLKCMMTLSELGLEPDGRRAHLIPFGQECTLIVDYKGLVELAKNSGDVSNIHAQVVCEKDEFTYDTGEIHHRIDFRTERGPIYAVYCVICFRDGSKHTEVMTKSEVDRIRGRSKAAKNGPWVSDYEEMAKKTVFRRASKWIKLSPEVNDALDRDADTAHTAVNLVSEIVPPAALPEATTDEPAPESDLEMPQDETPPIEIPSRQEKSQATPKAEQANSKSHTVQETLADIVTGAGHTYDDFARWAVKSGNWEQADSADGFGEVPNEIAKRLSRNSVGLLAGIAKEKGQE